MPKCFPHWFAQVKRFSKDSEINKNKLPKSTVRKRCLNSTLALLKKENGNVYLEENTLYLTSALKCLPCNMPGPPTTGGPGGHGPSTFLQKNAIPKFVDNRFNSL